MQNNKMKSHKKSQQPLPPPKGTKGIHHTFFDEGAREAFVGLFTAADVRTERTGRAASGRNAETREAASMLVDHWRRGGNDGSAKGGRERSESQGIPPGGDRGGRDGFHRGSHHPGEKVPSRQPGEKRNHVQSTQPTDALLP